MWTRYGFQFLPAIEHPVRKLGNLRMHPSLSAQDADEFGALLVVFPSDQALEEGVAAVGEADVLQDTHIDDTPFLTVVDGRDARILLALLHDGRQLLVVADEDELIYSR